MHIGVVQASNRSPGHRYIEALEPTDMNRLFEIRTETNRDFSQKAGLGTSVLSVRTVGSHSKRTSEVRGSRGCSSNVFSVQHQLDALKAAEQVCARLRACGLTLLGWRVSRSRCCRELRGSRLDTGARFDSASMRKPQHNLIGVRNPRGHIKEETVPPNSGRRFAVVILKRLKQA